MPDYFQIKKYFQQQRYPDPPIYTKKYKQNSQKRKLFLIFLTLVFLVTYAHAFLKKALFEIFTATKAIDCFG